MSVVLATDTYATIHPVIERLRRQTIAADLEIVLVTTSAQALGGEMEGLGEFAGVQLVEVASLVPLGVARAAGVRAARAPWVFIGETHTYAHPGWAEALMEAQGSWAVVVPAFGNANPKGALSWAGFLADYGPWTDGLPAGPIDFFPLNNSAYRRSVLLEFGDELGHALSHGDHMLVELRARGQRAYFAPAARIDHLNVARLGPWLGERFVAGLVIGWNRATGWSRLRRLVYVCASPLIPVVLLARTLSGVRHTAKHRRLPAGTIPAMLLASVVKAAGELVGYVRWIGDALAESRMTEYEVHKVDYARRTP